MPEKERILYTMHRLRKREVTTHTVQGSTVPYLLISLNPQHRTLSKCSLVPHVSLHCGKYYITRYLIS